MHRGLLAERSEGNSRGSQYTTSSMPASPPSRRSVSAPWRAAAAAAVRQRLASRSAQSAAYALGVKEAKALIAKGEGPTQGTQDVFTWCQTESTTGLARR